jgi:hypothetical protein
LYRASSKEKDHTMRSLIKDTRIGRAMLTYEAMVAVDPQVDTMPANEAFGLMAHVHVKGRPFRS